MDGGDDDDDDDGGGEREREGEDDDGWWTMDDDHDHDHDDHDHGDDDVDVMAMWMGMTMKILHFDQPSSQSGHRTWGCSGVCGAGGQVPYAPCRTAGLDEFPFKIRRFHPGSWHKDSNLSFNG